MPLIPAETVDPLSRGLRPAVVRYALYTLLLYLSWTCNLFGVESGVTIFRIEPQSVRQGYDSSLVLYRLRAAIDGVPTLHPLVTGTGPDDRPAAYLSQFGFQGVVLSCLMMSLPFEPGVFATLAAATCGALTAAAFAAVFAVGGRRFGALAGDVAAVLAAFSPVMLQFASSLYWVTFLLILPLTLTWVFGGVVGRSGPGWPLLLAAIGLNAFAKSLCGYEYLSTLVAMPLAGLWYHQSALGVPLARRWRAGVAVVSVGIAGASGAMAVHAAQLYGLLGHDPVAAIVERASARTFAGDLTGEKRHLDGAGWAAAAGAHELSETWGYPTAVFLLYFTQPVSVLPWSLGHGTVTLRLWHLLLLYCLIALVACVRGGRPFRAFVVSAGIALLAGLSWQILAVNHMCGHLHINLIVYLLGFVPLAFLIVGYTLRAFSDALGIRTAASWAVFGFVAVAAWQSLASAARRADALRDSEIILTEWVESLPHHDELPRDDRLPVNVDFVGTQRDLLPYMGPECGWLPMLARDCERDVVVIQGWVAEVSETRRHRTLVGILVTVNGRVAPARIFRYGRTDLESALGFRDPHAGFLAVLPADAVPPHADVCVLAASTSRPGLLTVVRCPVKSR